MSATLQIPEQAVGPGAQAWPLEVRALLDSMRKFARSPQRDRRRRARRAYEVEASVLYIRNAEAEPTRTRIYTRDATDEAVAFVTQTMFEANQSVTLDLPTPDGMSRRLEGTILRSRQFRDGWYDVVFQLKPVSQAPAAKQRTRWLGLFGRSGD